MRSVFEETELAVSRIETFCIDLPPSPQTFQPMRVITERVLPIPAPDVVSVTGCRFNVLQVLT